MVEKFKNIFFIRRKKDDGNYLDPSSEDLKYSALVCISVFPNPELTWPGQQDMYYSQLNKMSSLDALGIFNFEIREMTKGHDGFLEIAAEFPNLRLAQQAFSDATRVARVIDIYLYENGQLIDKLD
ncbi:MAG: hypothetical protein Q7S83_01590 [bacterium]|nr:hypothetical protein [bacterium]